MYGERSAAIDRLRYVKNGAFHVFVTFIATDWEKSARTKRNEVVRSRRAVRWTLRWFSTT
jgi:hypothetical protein